MAIDKTSFFIIVSTMAASAAGGWFARDKLVLRSDVSPPPPAPPPEVSSEPVKPAESAPAAAEPAKPPPCDDTSGEVPTCPVFPDPGDEGGCGQMARVRCEQYRESFKPKVASAAVECLKKLKPGQICDPIAVNKCGHEALMAACPAPDEELEPICRTISDACKASTPGPTPADCRQTLSGMKETGRKKMVTCLQKQCETRGLYGCEAR